MCFVLHGGGCGSPEEHKQEYSKEKMRQHVLVHAFTDLVLQQTKRHSKRRHGVFYGMLEQGSRFVTNELITFYCKFRITIVREDFLDAMVHLFLIEREWFVNILSRTLIAMHHVLCASNCFSLINQRKSFTLFGQ